MITTMIIGCEKVEDENKKPVVDNQVENIVEDNNDEDLVDEKNEVESEDEKKEEENEKEEIIEDVINYKTYYNSRFGCFIDYPDFLIEQPAPDNNDGRIFLSEDGSISLTCSGINNAMFTTAERMYNDEVERNSNITYKNLSERSYVISWEENNEIYYSCRVVGEKSINSFYIRYPKEKEEMFVDIVNRCYESFTLGDLSQYY